MTLSLLSVVPHRRIDGGNFMLTLKTVCVRAYWRRPAYSFGRGAKTEFVCEHYRRPPRQRFWLIWRA